MSVFGYLLLVSGLLLIFYWYHKLTYWKRRGVPYQPAWPVFGSGAGIFYKPKSIVDEVLDNYNSFPNSPFYGMHVFSTPGIVITDPGLVRAICIKDFEHFLDHSDIFIREDIDPLLAKNLVSLKGKRWKNMRSTLSPAFTGSKMRQMFYLMSECGEQMVQHYMDKTNEQVHQVEMKNLFSRYTTDVIATCAFGLKCDSFKHEKNAFFEIARSLADFSVMRVILTNLVPGLMKFFGQGIVRNYINEYFRYTVMKTMKTRDLNEIVRPDMIHLLMEARKGVLKHEDVKEKEVGYAVVQETKFELSAPSSNFHLSDDDIVAQALIFLMAGFQTSAIVLSFIAHELALNPDIQLRLQNEIDETLASTENGKLSYQCIPKMKYLDQVVSEGLRKYPPAPFLDRVCTKAYELKCGINSVTIEKGTPVRVASYGFHHDPNYFPDPGKFDPERFSNKNKGNIQDFTYMPFGLGPRSCIGSRFALLTVKVSLCHLLFNFDMVVIEKTQIPLQFLKSPVKMDAANGFWVGLQSRVK